MAEAERYPLDPFHPGRQRLTEVARRLVAGEVAAAPSDTVYGFLADTRSERAYATLCALKGRSGPFLVLIRSWEEAVALTRDVPEWVWPRLRRVWPGPITAILPTHPGQAGAADNALGLRMPASPFLEALLDEVGAPLFSTSANRPGMPPAEDAAEVLDAFPELPLVLDGGSAAGSVPSSVVDLSGARPRVIRRGAGDLHLLLDPP